MSHRESNIAPYVTSISPGSAGATGSLSIQIDGTRFTDDVEVTVPAALGTITSTPVVTYPTSLSSRVTFTVDVAALPASPVARQIILSNAGKNAASSSVGIHHGFEPANLLDNDGMWFDSTATADHNFDSYDRMTNWSAAAGKNEPLDPTLFFNDAWGTASINGVGALGARYNTGGYDGAIADTAPGSFQAGGLGNPWTMAIVVETRGSAEGANYPFFSGNYIMRLYASSPIGGGIEIVGGTDTGQYKRKIVATCDGTGMYTGGPNTNDIYYNITQEAAVYSIIATFDGTLTGLKLYINGVDQGSGAGAYTGGVVAAASSSYFLVSNNYGRDALVTGDILVKEKALSASDVALLHNYWASKFTIP